MPVLQFTRDLKKWFWGFLLGQFLVSVSAFLFFTGGLQKTVDNHTTDIEAIKVQLQLKADKDMVMRIKADNDKIMMMIYNDVQYNRTRIDEHMESSKK